MGLFDNRAYAFDVEDYDNGNCRLVILTYCKLVFIINLLHLTAW
jgi:hypothetical protein